MICALNINFAIAAPPEQATILVVGDSLSAEYGLRRGTGWVALLENKLSKEKKPYKVVNASISGDTTSGGRSRLRKLLEQNKPAIVILELGGNDALRGLPLSMTQINLQAMAQTVKSAKAKLLLVGIQVPPNYGKDYNEQLTKVFHRVAADNQATLLPFLLQGIADQPNAIALFQADRIHPTESAQTQLLNNVWVTLKPLLKK